MKEWVIEEYPIMSDKDWGRENLPNRPPREWCITPNIHDGSDPTDMEPEELEICIDYLRRDPFNEQTDQWAIRIRNINTDEEVMWDGIRE